MVTCVFSYYDIYYGLSDELTEQSQSLRLWELHSGLLRLADEVRLLKGGCVTLENAVIVRISSSAREVDT